MEFPSNPDLDSLPFVEPELLLASFSVEGEPAYRNDVWIRVLGEMPDPWSLLSDEEQTRARRFLSDAGRGLLVTNEFFLLPEPSDESLPLLLNFLPVHALDGDRAAVASVVVTGEVLREPDTWMQNQTQRNRIETLGRMTMGIAHDFNNLLSGILGYTELLKAAVAENDAAATRQDYLDTIERAALDGAALIRKIQQYIRQEQLTQFEPVDLPSLIHDCVSFTRPYWFNEPRRKGIAIQVDLDLKEVPPIMGSATELREVLINLLLNAVQAMPRGGRVAIRARVNREGNVRVDVSDSGTGMPKHVSERIFEPLFTTKGVKGSGMGLAVSYGIVQEHEGRIEVASEVGKGTKFTLTFPPASASSTRVAPAIPAPAAAPARVLVVDDEPMVRSLISKLLSRRGHEVITADSGPGALEMLKNDAAFDIVFTDHGMPDMNGRQLATLIRQNYPSLPIVLLTGDTEVGDADEIIDIVLDKPFKLEQLDAAIRELHPQPH